jgi:uncharacterized protein YbjQ (UPF0145 family)
VPDLIIFLVLLGLGYGFGRIAEQRHFRSIIRREKTLSYLPVIASRFPPAKLPPPKTCLVSGSVVVSVDYFKRFLARLRNLVGGRVKSYESLLDRARREAILRMKQQASELGATMVFNIKLETASISKGRKQKVGAVEVLAYGTAIIPCAAKAVAVEVQ